MATKKVKTKGFPDPIMINEEDFDPAIHKEVTEEDEKQVKVEAKADKK